MNPDEVNSPPEKKPISRTPGRKQEEESKAPEHMIASKAETGESSKRKRRIEPLDFDEKESQRTSGLLRILKEMTNCNKPDEADIIDATFNYIRAMQNQIQMMSMARNFMPRMATGMYYGMQWLPGFMFPPPRVWECTRLQPPSEAFIAATTFPEIYRPGIISPPQMLPITIPEIYRPGMISPPQMLAQFNPFQQPYNINPVQPPTTSTPVEPPEMDPSASASREKNKTPPRQG